MEKEKVAVNFRSVKEDYQRLGNNIVDALKSFLDDRNISYVDIYSRVKSFDSFYEKIGRKSYKNPFDEIEDICGVRVVCYYHSDVTKINDIIASEFNVLESQNKSELLGLNEFAYRSQHFIVSLNDNWLSAPNYRKLDGLKAEIQVRTILMHAWAEIEHKLNYKSDAQVPEQFQRKLFRISAKLEEADEQFVELKAGIDEYREQLAEQLVGHNTFDLTQSLNRDSFLTFMKYCFPDQEYWDSTFVDRTFDNAKENYGDFQHLDEIYSYVKNHIDDIAEELLAQGYENDIRHNPTEIIAFGGDVVFSGAAELEGKVDNWVHVVNSWKEKLDSKT
ncbi:GTP pyrophosphokinase [Vibrio antiquarius]|nr:(p)ppGpp synthetase [Vibrio fluvialis]